ncbi:MAG: DUF6263 family protein [Gemmataceae bacterium]|nr:DUF6263 family protein [Gemmataceae bacterium]
MHLNQGVVAVLQMRLLVASFTLTLLAALVIAQDSKTQPPVKEPSKGTTDKQETKKEEPKEPKKEEPKEPKKEEPKEPKKEEPKKEEPKKEEPKSDPNARTFAPKFEKDKKFYQELKTQVSQVIKVQGQDVTQKQESTYYFKWNPVKQTGDKWELEQEVEGLKVSIDISGNTINYDSTQSDASVTAGNPTLMEFFKKLVGTKFVVTLDKAFRVESVSGKDEFIRKLSGGNNQLDSLFRNIVTDDSLKQMCDPTFYLVPDTPKKPGDSWEKKAVISLGPIGSYEVTYRFKYVGPSTEEGKKDYDKIEVETDIVYVIPKGTASDGLFFRIKEGKLEQPKGMGEQPPKGVIYYDPKTQRIVSAEITLKLKGELTVNIGATDSKVELYQEQKTTLRTGDSSFLSSSTSK